MSIRTSEAKFEKQLKSRTTKAVTIPPIELSHVRITLEGTSPLLMNKFTEKSKREMEEKQQKVAKRAKAARDPKAEFLAALYVIPGKKNQYGIPAGALKKTAVNACRFVDGVKMTQVNGAFHIEGGPANLVPFKASKPVMDEQMVRIGPFGNKVAMPRYRPRFDKWEVSFDATYNPRCISPEQLLNLYENAGFSVGILEFRPEKGGSFGRFRVKRK